MARTSTPWELVSVYKVMGLPSKVPKGVCSTPGWRFADVCATSRLAIVSERKTAAPNELRVIMAMSLLRDREFVMSGRAAVNRHPEALLDLVAPLQRALVRGVEVD
jgi:hypothetical protein